VTVSADSYFVIGSQRLLLEAYYDASHLWVLPDGRRGARCGFDPLGAETAGDIVAVSFEPVGTTVARGGEFGSLEAAKFVGPLISPVSGKITAHNEEVIAQPTLLHDDPATHWLFEIELTNAAAELPVLRRGEADVRAWFESETARFKEQGMIAE